MALSPITKGLITLDIGNRLMGQGGARDASMRAAARQPVQRVKNMGPERNEPPPPWHRFAAVQCAIEVLRASLTFDHGEPVFSALLELLREHVNLTGDFIWAMDISMMKNTDSQNRTPPPHGRCRYP